MYGILLGSTDIFGINSAPFGDHFRLILGSLSDDFGIILGCVWDHFGINLGSLRHHFGITLASFWHHFGISLGEVWEQFGLIWVSSCEHDQCSGGEGQFRRGGTVGGFDRPGLDSVLIH